jgi:hypothetical protein
MDPRTSPIQALLASLGLTTGLGAAGCGDKADGTAPTNARSDDGGELDAGGNDAAYSADAAGSDAGANYSGNICNVCGNCPAPPLPPCYTTPGGCLEAGLSSDSGSMDADAAPEAGGTPVFDAADGGDGP